MKLSHSLKSSHCLLAALLTIFSVSASADVATAQKIADKYAAAAKAIDSTYAGPSAEEGKVFFNREVIQFKGDVNALGKAIACASCHTANPADAGKHIVTGKLIKPLSPHINKKRFQSTRDVEKNFTKHCNEVVGSDCSPQEKANYIAYLLTEKAPSKK
jgi:cytochrome c553